MNVITQSLANKNILITGASYGIGAHMALAYARQGAKVILLARTQSLLENTYDLIKQEGLPPATIIPFDLSCNDIEMFYSLANLIKQHIGHLDGALFNAGVLGQKSPIESYNIESWKKVMDTNINGQFLLAKTLIPLLANTGNSNEVKNHSSMIFTSSSVGRKGRAFWGAYSVSKFATEALMQILSDEIYSTHNIRVNCINPGATQTSMRAEAYPAENPKDISSPKDIESLYIYLMSDASTQTNGQSLDAQNKTQ
jgi:NAD(P)-dependent dehydrogenase (short-subunit alcohol dehydrogenase family)